MTLNQLISHSSTVLVKTLSLCLTQQWRRQGGCLWLLEGPTHLSQSRPSTQLSSHHSNCFKAAAAHHYELAHACLKFPLATSTNRLRERWSQNPLVTQRKVNDRTRLLIFPSLLNLDASHQNTENKQFLYLPVGHVSPLYTDQFCLPAIPGYCQWKSLAGLRQTVAPQLIMENNTIITLPCAAGWKMLRSKKLGLGSETRTEKNYNRLLH